MHRRVIAIACLGFMVLTFPVSVVRGDTFAPRPAHDWTIRTTRSVWGLASDGSRTVLLAGTSHLVIPLPFYAVAAPLLALLAFAVIAGGWRVSRWRARR